MAFSVLKTSLVNPRYLWAALKVTRENLVRMTANHERTVNVLMNKIVHLAQYARLPWETSSSTAGKLLLG